MCYLGSQQVKPLVGVEEESKAHHAVRERDTVMRAAWITCGLSLWAVACVFAMLTSHVLTSTLPWREV